MFNARRSRHRRRHPREVPDTLLLVPVAEARQASSLVQLRAQGFNTTGTQTTEHKQAHQQPSNVQVCPKALLKSSTTHAIVKSVPRRLDGYNLGTGFDLDHTTVELLNDAMQRSPGQHATTAPPRSHEEGSIVITLARLTLTILQAQSIRSRLHSMHYCGGNRVHYNSAKFTHGSIV